jgi:hypothetical protein
VSPEELVAVPEPSNRALKAATPVKELATDGSSSFTVIVGVSDEGELDSIRHGCGDVVSSATTSSDDLRRSRSAMGFFEVGRGGGGPLEADLSMTVEEPLTWPAEVELVADFTSAPDSSFVCLEDSVAKVAAAPGDLGRDGSLRLAPADEDAWRFSNRDLNDEIEAIGWASTESSGLSDMIRTMVEWPYVVQEPYLTLHSTNMSRCDQDCIASSADLVPMPHASRRSPGHRCPRARSKLPDQPKPR